jgi:hypothetical protein
VAEFDRLQDKVQKFWKLKDTPKVERTKVQKVLSQIRAQGISHDSTGDSQRNVLASITEYARMMKEYYLNEARIRNIY